MRYVNEAGQLFNHDGDLENTMERLKTIASLLNKKIQQVKELDIEILDLCDVSIIERGIEESEEVYSCMCDVQAKITKFTSRSVGMINKSEVKVHETTNTEQNTDGNQSSSTSSQSPCTDTYVQGTGMHVQNTNALKPGFEHANSQGRHKFNTKSAYSSEIEIAKVSPTKI
jgi:hypothetical protein